MPSFNEWDTTFFDKVKMFLQHSNDAGSQAIVKSAIVRNPDGKMKQVIVDLDRGLNISYLASRQVEEVSMTPYMKNALRKFNDIKDGERLTVSAPVTKAELYIQRRINVELIKQFGSRTAEYDRSLPILDVKHYAVDCYRNSKDGILMRDIQPGQQKQREIGFSEFRKPAPTTPNILSDRYVRVAIRNVIGEMPSKVRRSDEFRDWSGPFENKHTQTSWPFFYRDDVVISAENDATGSLTKYYGMTYGQACVEIAKHTPISDTVRMGVNVGYGRNQRGKGRPLIAMARIPAVLFNRMTMPETQACKTKSPLFIGYNDRETLKSAMVKQANFVTDNNLAMENFDYHAFDQSISKQWMAVAGAVWLTIAADKESKEIVYYRTLLSMSGVLIDGIADADGCKVSEINGRMTSGFIETNKTENVINAIASTSCMLKQDDQWINKIQRRSPYPQMYMGDDCLITYDPLRFSHDDYVEHIKGLGFEIHQEKGEFGAFFLQNRLFKDDEGYIFTYPWTRVLRSMLFKEKSRGLGPAGWTLASYSQLANIVEYKPGLAFVRDLICEFDEEKLMLSTDISEIIAKVKQEDEQALEVNKRAQSTFDVINDGDPGKVQIGVESSRYLRDLQKKIREA